MLTTVNEWSEKHWLTEWMEGQKIDYVNYCEWMKWITLVDWMISPDTILSGWLGSEHQITWKNEWNEKAGMEEPKVEVKLGWMNKMNKSRHWMNEYMKWKKSVMWGAGGAGWNQWVNKWVNEWYRKVLNVSVQNLCWDCPLSEMSHNQNYWLGKNLLNQRGWEREGGRQQ